MAIDLGYTLTKELFLDTSIFGLGWIIPLAIIAMSILLISRNTTTWKETAFPITIAWYTAGLKSGTLFDQILIITTAIIFVMETLSIETAQNIATTVATKSREAWTRITEEEREIAKKAATKAKTDYLEEKMKTTAGIRRIKDKQQKCSTKYKTQ